MRESSKRGDVMRVHIEPDTCWGFEPPESIKFSTYVPAMSVEEARRSPRPQAGRGLSGVQMLMNYLQRFFRRRMCGGIKGEKTWTTTITISSVVDRPRGGEVFSSYFCKLQKLSILSLSFLKIKRRPHLIGIV